jgi:chromosome segregation ATPase
MAFDTTGATKAQVIAELRRLESVEAALLSQITSLNSTITSQSETITSLQLDVVEANAETQALLNEAVVKDSLLADNQVRISELESELIKGDAVIDACRVMRDALVDVGLIEVIE